MKLYTYPALFRTQKVLIAAQYAQVKLDVDTNVTTEMLAAKSLHGTVPLLELDDGQVLAESNAIARYIASFNTDAGIHNASKGALESAMVDSWLEYCSNNLEIPSTMWVAPIVGWMENNPAVTSRAQGDLKKAMTILEAHLKTRTYFVGRHITLADIAIATTLLLPMKLVLDSKARAPYPCLMRWFETCINQPEFVKVIGEVTLCKTPLKAPEPSKEQNQGGKPEGGGKKKDKQQQKKEKKKGGGGGDGGSASGDKRGKDDASAADGDAAPQPQKKPKNPLDLLPPSKFNLEEWKRVYSNPSNPDDYYTTMPWFWDNLDREGFSVFLQSYKHNEENTVPFMVSNLVGGFIQRCDELRKHAFGVMQIIGAKESGIEIVGAWVLRGDSIQPMLDANPDAEYYNWTKVTDFNESVKKEIADIWCSDDKVYGKPIIDGKVFK